MYAYVLEREIYWIVLQGMSNPAMTEEAGKLVAADLESLIVPANF